MNETVPFAILRDLLTRLGFTETEVPGSHLSFEHAPSATILVYREYGAEDDVTAGDLVKTRKFLDEKGLLTPKEFEAVLHEGVRERTLR